MVNISSPIDGQTFAIEGQEGQDPDEPPIPRPPTSEKSSKQNGSESIVSALPTLGSFGSIAAAWDGNPNTAHTIDAFAVAAYLEVNPSNGLSPNEATKRLERDGYNKLDGAGQVSIGEILLRQVSNSLTIVLVIAMALAYGTLDFIEGAVISAVILLNICLGFYQDYDAEKKMNGLLQLAAPSANVMRNGIVENIKVETLVMGDVVVLKNGDKVSADMRLLETFSLETDESLLTGESLASSKDANKHIDYPDAPTGDKINMAFSGTTVARGRATGIVVATGMKTEMGKIAELLSNKPTKKSSNPFIDFLLKIQRGFKSILGLVGTPMQVKLSKFAILLFGLAILLALIVFSANKWQLDNEVILYGICVAVAVIPESLIAVMTLTISGGAREMSKGNVIVRDMACLEAVGGVTNICSDKTGTLTQGKMVAHKVWVPKMGILTVKNGTEILDPEDADLSLNDEPFDKSSAAAQSKVLQLRPVVDAAALCNLATISRSSTGASSVSEKGTSNEWKSNGDPTEVALQVLALRFGRGKEFLLQEGNLEAVMEHQFDSSLKRMSVAFKGHGKIEVSAKGASEVMIPLLKITEKEQTELNSMVEQLSSEGLRVVCIATKDISEEDEHQLADREFAESNLTLRGLVGIYDPPRIESLSAVQQCHQAGIQVHMLTGDHLGTATAIAEKVGILKPGMQAGMRAQDFDKLSDAEIDAMPSLPVVLARCSPTTKVRMVDALKRRRAFCVMTGDGVNDAPALKRADVGISMGKNGTDVAKEASAMSLTDDNFASIVKAVEEGRRLFDNIQKFLMHLLISNIAQVILLLIALAFKDTHGSSVFPLSPLEILWVNMITSSFLALGLGMEEAQADIMIRPPRDLKVGVFTWELITDKMLYGTWAGILCLLSFVAVVYGGGNGNLGQDCNEDYNSTCDTVFRARATVFAVLSFILLVTAWEVKHFTRSLFNLDPARYKGKAAVFKALAYNRFLLWAVVAGAVITFPVIYIPVVNVTVFKHKGIGWEWGVVGAALVAYVAFVEGWKAVKRRFGIFGVRIQGVEGGCPV